MKKIVGLMLILSLVISFISENDKVYAIISGDYEYSISNNEVTITGYTGVSADISIPDQIDGMVVTRIGDEAFYAANLTSVIIPNTVTAIGSRAFNSNQLKSVTIPESVLSISDRVFTYNALEELILNNGLQSIGDYAFSSNQLVSITIPDSVTVIGEGAFFFNLIKNVSLPSSLTNISRSAFMSNELTDIVIPNTVTTISNGAFHSNNLTNVTIPEGVTRIEENAFSINKLTSLTIPNSVTTIENNAFSYNQLTQLTIPNSVTSIGYSVFSSNQLTNVTLSDNLTSIPYGAFDSNNLIDITIPASVTSINDYAFSYNNLSSITFQGSLSILNLNAITSQTKVGHTFKNWYSDETRETAWDFSNTIAANTTLYAGYDINTYTVSFNSNGGSDIADKTNVNYDTLITAPTMPTKSGYTFDGWYTEPSLLTKWDFSLDKVKQDTTLYAGYIINTYTVSFNSNGGSDIADKTNVNYDTLIAAPTMPTKSGYTFNGWYTEPSLLTKWDFSLDKVKQDTTLYAGYDVNTYTVSFNSNGGSDIADKTNVNYDTSVTAPTIPTKSGYTFGGWYTEPSLLTKWDFSLDKVKQDTILYAKWNMTNLQPYIPPVNGEETSQPNIPPIIEEEIEGDVPVEQYFIDIDGHWAEETVKQAVELGITSGYPDGSFRPNEQVTREEFAVMLAKALNLDSDGQSLAFSDGGDIGAWAVAAIERTVKHGILNGYPDGSFRPQAKVTRAELAVMLANALGEANTDESPSYADDTRIPTWAKASVTVLKQYGIMQGRVGNIFDAQDVTTRAEALTALIKLITLIK